MGTPAAYTGRQQAPQHPAEPQFHAQPVQTGGERYQPDPRSGRPQQPMPDSAGYDLGSYAVPPAPLNQRHPAPPQGVNWPPEPPGFQDPGHAQPQMARHESDHAAHGQFQDPNYGYAAQQAHEHTAGEEDVELDDDYEYEDEPRGGRRWLIVAALVGSIAVGGAMAYGYKALMGSSSGAKSAQVIKAPRDPVRIAPQSPGGKTFAKGDEKFMNRLPSSGGGVVASAATTDSSGVRRVPTVRVGPDLAVAPPPVNDAPPSSSQGVPGMTIIGGANAPPSLVPPQGPPMQALPRRQEFANAAVPASPPVTIQRSAPPPAVRRPPPPPRQREAAVAPPTQPAARTRNAARTTGFVTVLGYQKGRMEALRMMADLQQKYGALQGQKLDVIESDQSARGLGVIYRVVAGPPVARTTANELCKKLKQTGFKGCWAMAK